jgi:2-polyprenyl-3-methyl-5-hydroxy-6-metoxy-1,4-benzoquinol methylase
VAEIDFEKYRTRGAYHWQQVSLHPSRSNAIAKARYRKCVELLHGSMGRMVGSVVLDMGCGDGVLAWMLSRAGAAVHGVDPSLEAIQFARQMHDQRRTGAEFRPASGYSSGYPDAHFDAVVSSDVIEHVMEPDRLLAEIRRVLKPGGIAILSTPIRLTEKPLDPMHVVEWFPGEFEGLVRRSFPSATFYQSHPVWWMEAFQRGKLQRICINLLSVAWNPFLGNDAKFLAMQYAVAAKD